MIDSHNDKELEEILRKKQEEYLKKLEEEKKKREQEALLKQNIKRNLFTAEAREVLNNLELRGDTKLVEQILSWAYMMYSQGRLRDKITKEQLQVILKHLRSEEKKDWKIDIKRK